MTSIASISSNNYAAPKLMAGSTIAGAALGGLVGKLAHKNPLITAGIFGAAALAMSGIFSLVGNGPVNQPSEECWDGKDGQYLTHPFASQC